MADMISKDKLREEYFAEIDYMHSTMTDPKEREELREDTMFDFFDYAEFVGRFLVGVDVITREEHEKSVDKLREAE